MFFTNYLYNRNQLSQLLLTHLTTELISLPNIYISIALSKCLRKIKL